MSISKISGFSRAVAAFRKGCDDSASVQKLAVFLEIGMTPGIDNQTLIHRLQLSRSNASKLVRDLTELTARKTPGPGLVRQDIDPMDMTRRMARLTPKGEMLFKELQDAL